MLRAPVSFFFGGGAGVFGGTGLWYIRRFLLSTLCKRSPGGLMLEISFCKASDSGLLSGVRVQCVWRVFNCRGLVCLEGHGQATILVQRGRPTSAFNLFEKSHVPNWGYEAFTLI